MSPWRDCRCVIALSRLRSLWLSSSRLSPCRCPPCGMSSAGCLLRESSLSSREEFILSYKDSSILPMPSISLAQLPPDRQTDRQRKHTEPLTTPITYNTRLPHPLTKTNHHHTQWLSATLPHTSARATSALSLRTLSRATPRMPRHAATRTSLAVVTIGPVEFRATPSISTTDRLMGQLHDPAQPKVRDDPPSSHSCSPLPHTAKSHAEMISHSASSRQLTIKSSVPIASTRSTPAWLRSSRSPSRPRPQRSRACCHGHLHRARSSTS